tara:strand:- start:7272 stop:8108 length:837 start_codon:yes stop_codon:yes gene_type:complete
MLNISRKEFADLIISRLKEEKVDSLKTNYQDSSKINYLIIDNLLPEDLASSLDKDFPNKNHLKLRSETQERKYIASNWKSKSKLVEECLFSFQEERVLQKIAKICSIKDLTGDPELYAGGISFMNKDCFLNPHIDNSHDRLRKKYRRLNLLYYVTKDWDSKENGGELLLYPNGIKKDPIVIETKFNRLVIMRTDNKSLHAVKKIKSINNGRKCISNYYFSLSSPSGSNYYHSTSFRGFKDEKIKDIYFRVNALARTSLKTITGNFFGKFINTGHHKKN